jgi:hypothetical protein
VYFISLQFPAKQAPTLTIVAMDPYVLLALTTGSAALAIAAAIGGAVAATTNVSLGLLLGTTGTQWVLSIITGFMFWRVIPSQTLYFLCARLFVWSGIIFSTGTFGLLWIGLTGVMSRLPLFSALIPPGVVLALMWLFMIVITILDGPPRKRRRGAQSIKRW